MNVNNYTVDEIIKLIPHKEPFRFIDKITYIDSGRIEGCYFFHRNHEFYQGHFPDYPLTPGVILIEVMAQIGLVAFGLYLLTKIRQLDMINTSIPVLSSVDVKFCRKVLPGEYVFVKAEKTLFRHGKLVCSVKLYNNNDGIIAEGSISGFISNKD